MAAGAYPGGGLTAAPSTDITCGCGMAVAALIAAAADGKALVDDVCAKRAIAELNRD